MSAAVPKASRPEKAPQRVIFVVDDEAMLLELACVILEPLGYGIRTFRDPAAALAAFKAANPRPALVITDYSMHTMNGLSLIEGCRRLEPRQRILLVSGTVGPDVLGGARVKPDAFLAKPYQARQLIEQVQSMLAH